MHTPTFHVDAAPRAAVGIRPFVVDGELRLAVIVKIGLDLQQAAASIIEPPPITLSEVYEDDHVFGNLVEASDLALRKSACDVTLIADARSLGDRPASVLPVRLAIYRGSVPLLNKVVVAMSATPEGISVVPLTYRHTFGGLDIAANPIGSRAPMVQLARDAQQRPACFAPIPSGWPIRRDRFDKTARGTLASAIPVIRGEVDWGYFQSAPADQTIPFLLGGEWMLVDGVSATQPRVQTQLPSFGARAVIVQRGGATTEVPLQWDTLAIDGRALRASAVLRGDVASPLPIARSTDLAVVVRFDVAGALQVPDDDVLFSDQNLARALYRALPISLDETAALTETAHARAARRAPTPYGVQREAPATAKASSGALPGAPWSRERAQPVMPAFPKTRATVPLREEDLRPPEVLPDPHSLAQQVPSAYPASPSPPPLLSVADAPHKAGPAADSASKASRVALATAALRKSGMSEASLAEFISQLEREIGSDV